MTKSIFEEMPLQAPQDAEQFLEETTERWRLIQTTAGILGITTFQLSELTKPDLHSEEQEKNDD